MSAGRTSGRGRHRLHRNNRAQLRTTTPPAVDIGSAVSVVNRGLLIPPQQRTARLASRGYSRFIGRVGALAVALGVGVGFTTSMPGLAWADDTDSSASADSSSPNSTSEQSDTTTATDTTTSTASTGSDSPSNPSEGDTSADDPETGIVQSSGGAQTGSYGPNATAPSSDDDTDTEPATSDALDGSESTDTASTVATDAATTDTPAPSGDPVTPQTPAPQDDSTTAGNTSATGLDSESAGKSSEVDVLDDPTSISTATGSGESTDTLLFTTSGAEGGGSQLLAASGPEENSVLTAAQDTSLAAEQDPVQALMAIPGTIVSIAGTLVAALLSPFLAPGPVAPAQPPLLWALLAWVQREVQRTFFNRSPDAVSDAVTTSEDITVSGNVLSNDTDADGEPLTATLVTGPAHGDVTLNPDGSFTYTPDANYNGTDTFTYKVSDETSGWHLHGLFGFLSPDGGHTDTATVTVNIAAVNDAPVAGDDSATIAEDTQASGNVLTNDSDIESAPLTAALGTGPANGVAVVNANGTFTYTPNANFNGADTFTYTVSDGAATDTGTVTVTVTPVPDAPVAVDDTATVAEDSGFSVIDVLANDSDADGDDLDITLVTFPVNGDVFTNNGTISYRPAANFTGTETFTYSISDGSTSDTATVTVTVGPANDMPVTSGDAYTVAEDGTLTVPGPGVLGNDTDLDGDPLTAVLFENPSNGTVVLNTDGSFSYTPNANFTGTDSFSYYANDGTTDSNPSFVNITVTATNDAVVAHDDTNMTVTNDPVTGNVLTNDVAQNPDGPSESLTVTTTAPITTTGGGSVTIASDGSYTYTPATGFTGVDTFTYTVSDGLTSDVGQVSITVSEGVANTAPVAGWDSLATPANTPLIITDSALLANDFDAEGDPLSVTVTEAPLNGTLLANANGTYTYTADPGFTGRDIFSYVATDATGQSVEARVTIAVGEPANTAPVADDDTLATGVDTPLTITYGDLLDGDVDPDGDDMIAFVVSDPAHGTLEYNAPDGNFIYTPDPGFVGTDTFSYTAFDGEADSTPATVTITVGDAVTNVPPVANDDMLSTTVDTPLVFTEADLVDNDTDADGDELHVNAATEPLHGTLTGNQDGTVTYTPEPGFTGTDTFTYLVTDGQDVSNIATVTITVGDALPTNTAPAPGFDSLATAAGTPLTFTDDDLLANDYDAEADPLTVIVTQAPANGTLVLNPDGTHTYTPNANFTGPDQFGYAVNDGQATSSYAALVTINVGVPPNTTPTATADELSTDVDTPLLITAADLVANDTDPDGPADLTAYAVSDPAHGTLERDPSDGSYTYTPDAGYEGTDTFYYTAFDGAADSTPTLVTVTVTVVSQM